MVLGPMRDVFLMRFRSFKCVRLVSDLLDKEFVRLQTVQMLFAVVLVPHGDPRGLVCQLHAALRLIDLLPAVAVAMREELVDVVTADPAMRGKLEELLGKGDGEGHRGLLCV